MHPRGWCLTDVTNEHAMKLWIAAEACRKRQAEHRSLWLCTGQLTEAVNTLACTMRGERGTQLQTKQMGYCLD